MPTEDLMDERDRRRYARAEKDYDPCKIELPPDVGAVNVVDEPPPPRAGRLVPGSRFSDEDWERAAYMIASGCPMIQVAKTMGASRATIWRAYTTSPDFRTRIWWERQHVLREAKARIRSLRAMVATQLEHAVTRGDMTTVRWLAARLGVLEHDKDDDPPAFRGQYAPTPEDIARFAAMPEEERPYGYPGFPREATMTPLPVENLP